MGCGGHVLDVLLLRTHCEHIANIIDNRCLNEHHTNEITQGHRTGEPHTKGIKIMANDKQTNTSTTSTNDASTTHEGDYVEDMRSRVSQVEVKTKKNGLPRGVHRDETSTNGRDKRMTAKMHAFASNVVQGMSPSDAYRRAYDTSNMSEASTMSEANRLLKDPRITQLLESFWTTLKENVIADAVSTRRHIMAELYEHAQNKEAQLSNRLKSLELMGRAVGMFTDKVETKTEEVNVDTLKKELESSLLLLQSAKPKSLLN